MSVPLRYILASIAFGVAAFTFMLAPNNASADCNGCNRPQPPCHSCQPPAPPPCHSCQPPTVIVPPPHVPPPNIVVVNAGARASAQASAIAIAVANVRAGDTIIRQNSYVEAGAGAVAVTSTAMAVTESAYARTSRTVERDYLIQAICLDERNNPHPASQTFGGRDVGHAYAGELYRCMSGTRMRYTINNSSHDCAPGEALWYENGAVACRPQVVRRPCNERSLLRRFGPGDKLVRVRETEAQETRQETTYNGAMTMDGGVGAGF